MKSYIILILFTSVVANGFAQESTKTHLDQLNWLCKKWQRSNIKPGRTAFESWVKQGSSLKGIGLTLQGSDTVFVEHLSISYHDGELYYISEVAHNPAPVYFKMEITGAKSFVSKNPEHDFPKQIEYESDGEYMTATISGDGKKIPFRFKKME
ncbi:MAG: hypothetical protein AAGF85_03510 [Bacteroidota bacterium]